MEMLFTVPWYDVIWCDIVAAHDSQTVLVGQQPKHIALFMENLHLSAVTLFVRGCVLVRVCERGLHGCVNKAVPKTERMREML